MMVRWLGVLVLLVGCQSQTTITKEKKKLTTSPDLVDIATVTVGDSATADIELTHVAGGEIKVVNLSILNIAGSWFSVDDTEKPVIAPEETTSITIHYDPLEAGYHRAQITITTDEEDNGKHIVELRGAAAFPSADVFPPVLDFGPVAVGNTSEQDITVRNSGTVRLDLAGLAFNNAVFTSTQAPTSLDAGDELVVPVIFTPTNPDLAEGAVSLDLGAAPPRSVDLRGNACKDGDGALYDVDQDGYTACAGDCDDSNNAAHPGGLEVCDTVDNDCDGTADESTNCADDDGDGISELDGDCNDRDASVFPGNTEDVANGKDDDCDGIVDLGACDFDFDGYCSSAGDCDDADTTVFPGATELEDAIDNDCDGATDEGTLAFDDDSDGYTEAAGDCDDTNSSISPGVREKADGLDNDCDGTVDNGTASHDDDGDGFTENGGDCNDADASISPGIVEVKGDSIDNNCDGLAQ